MSEDLENKGNEEDKVDMAALTDALKGLPEGVQNAVTKAINDVGEKQLAAQAEAAKNIENDDEDKEEDIDLEKLDRSGFAKHLEGNFSKTLSKALKPIVDKLNNSTESVEIDRVKVEFKEAAANHSDFMEWKDEMRKIVVEHPDLSAERIYSLARSEDPEKAKELDAKAAEGKEGGDKEGKKPFLGLTPTSGKGNIKNEKMTQKEASEDAWDQTMGQISEEMIGSA